MSAFFKFTRVGQSAVGRVERYQDGKNGMSPFIAMSPVMLSGANGLEQWQGAAIGLTTELALKIAPTDKGLYLMITLKGFEPTSKGSPRKLFSVSELEHSEILELAAASDKTHRQEPYVPAETAPANTSAGATTDDDEDLPF